MTERGLPAEFGDSTLYLKLSPIVLVLSTIIAASAAAQEKSGVSVPQVGQAASVAQKAEQEPPLQGYEFEFPSMGTLIEITAYAENEAVFQKALDEIQSLTKTLAATLTDYDPESETRQLTLKAFQKSADVSAPLWEVLLASQHWNKASEGAFDCSVGLLTQTWRKHRRAGRVPKDDVIQDAKSHCGWSKVKLDEASKTIRIEDDQLRLDFGAIGKGYIADRAFQVLEQHGIHRCLINISGNMRCGQAPPNKPGWVIAISPIERDGEPIRKLTLSNVAIATSGDLWQYTLVDGVKRSHILDPQTGYGVVGPLAVTVIAPTATDADALATIGCLLPWDKYSKLIATRPETSALRASRITQQLEVVQTEFFPKQ